MSRSDGSSALFYSDRILSCVKEGLKQIDEDRAYALNKIYERASGAKAGWLFFRRPATKADAERWFPHDIGRAACLYWGDYDDLQRLHRLCVSQPADRLVRIGAKSAWVLAMKD